MLKAWWERLRGTDARPEPEEVGAFRREAAAVTGDTPVPVVEALLERGRRVADADVELELESLQARLDVAALEARVAAAGLPVVETQHKALGDERCHFTCPATLADGETDVSGRLLLGERRLLFLGGRGLSAAWGTVRAVEVDGRSLVVKVAAATLVLACNTFSDAHCAAFIAASTMRPRGEPPRASS